MIFDTSIWIGLVEGQFTDEQILDAAGDELVFVSAVSLGELGLGVESCLDPTMRMIRARHLRALLQRPILDVNAQTASAYGMLAASMKKRGRSPRTRVNDFWLAAQAVENDYAILTANPKDFVGLPGLRVVRPRN